MISQRDISIQEMLAMWHTEMLRQSDILYTRKKCNGWQSVFGYHRKRKHDERKITLINTETILANEVKRTKRIEPKLEMYHCFKSMAFSDHCMVCISVSYSPPI